MDAVLKRHRRFGSVLAAVVFNVFDGFRSQNPPGRANIRRQGRFWKTRFRAVEPGRTVRQALRWPTFLPEEPFVGRGFCELRAL